jgi:hypothetical protein
MPPWSNKWLIAAIALSMGLHFFILYVDFMAVSISHKNNVTFFTVDFTLK